MTDREGLQKAIEEAERSVSEFALSVQQLVATVEEACTPLLEWTEQLVATVEAAASGMIDRPPADTQGENDG